MLTHRLGTLAALAVVALGAAATAAWLSTRGALTVASEKWTVLVGALAVTAVLTAANITLRWLRWHNLTRRIGVPIPTRDSLRLYLATLPAIATPYYLGELVRAAVLRRRAPNATQPLVAIWLAERLSDAAAVLVLVLAANASPWAIAVLIAWPLLHVIFIRARASTRHSGLDTRGAVFTLMTLSLAAWALPAAALAVTLRLLDTPVSVAKAVSAFGTSTLLGGLSGIPLGTALTGGALISSLRDAGTDFSLAPVIVATFRAATSWFAILLGVACLIRWRRELVGLARTDPAHHFNEIGAEYDQQMPAHVRDRLIDRKADLMRAQLAGRLADDDARGLEVGCGHGWYACRMASFGYRMSAFDSSISQVEVADQYVREHAAAVTVHVADATLLPHAGGIFDFAYGVNVLHHIDGEASRARALQEVVRTLRPGGIFFLHEINSNNLLFRFYMGYVFPLIRDIDEGTEAWIHPRSLPAVAGAHWQDDVHYFTFLPDFLPPGLHRRLAGVERLLERSRIRGRSAHFVACLVKDEQRVAPDLREVSGSTEVSVN